MQIEIRIDSLCTETKLIVVTDKITDEINNMIRKLAEETPQVLCGFHEDTLEILNQADIIRLYCAAGKIFAVTGQREYMLRLRLYELEDRLDKRSFVRISNSEIIFAACSVIWEMDRWSIAKQTCIYFLITSLVMMPIAYFTNWMEHTIIGFLLYFGIFAAIFIAVWFVQYRIWKNKVKKINSKFDKKQTG